MQKPFIASSRTRGQAVVEYILVTALVTLAATALFRAFRQDLEQAYRQAGASLIQSVDAGGRP